MYFIMGWYKDIKIILAQEPESWMAYLYGRQLAKIPHLRRGKPLFRGVFFQLAKFVLHLLRNFRIRQHKLPGKDLKCFVFAGSVNQINALESTLDSLKQDGESVFAVAPAGIIRVKGGTQQYRPLGYSFLDLCKTMFLLARRGPALYQELRKVHPIAVSSYFSAFCSVYSYLCSFHRLLSDLTPEFVITSNDHNAPNRCMLAVAHHLGIKTLYLQHASVSNLFPALRVNYAFLDGECALETYRECEPNQPTNRSKAPLPYIFLTGQKKRLVRRAKAGSRVTGIALNSLDNPDKAVEFVKYLADAGLTTHVRWHPGQGREVSNKYIEALGTHTRVSLSNPMAESVSDFMERIGWLIAGNSSIHLEAALAGVKPVYYELTPSDHPDYYGYVKHGLSRPAKSPSDIIALISESSVNAGQNINIIQYYSATYHTKWDGKEGELVAECIKRISSGKATPIEARTINWDMSSA